MDLNNVRMVLGPGIMYGIPCRIDDFASVVLMVHAFAAPQRVWVLLPVPVVAVVVWYFGQVIRLYRKFRHRSPRSTQAQEKIAGVRVVPRLRAGKRPSKLDSATRREYVTLQPEAHQHLEHVRTGASCLFSA